MYIMRTDIQIENLGTMIRRFGHEEECQNTHQDESSRHSIIQCREPVILVDRTGNRTGDVDSSKHSKIENCRSKTTLMDKPDVGDTAGNKTFVRSHEETLDGTESVDRGHAVD